MQIVKHFYSEQIASIFLMQLQAEGIDCFLSNTATSTLVPFGEGGISLHVNDNDVLRAIEIITEVEKRSLEKIDKDFKDADLDDILYEKEVNDYEENLKQSPRNYLIFLLIIIFLILILMLSFNNFTL
jgi:hypothetical protein